MIQFLKDYISDNSIDISIIKKDFYDNYSKILRKSYDGRIYSNNEIIYLYFKNLIKTKKEEIVSVLNMNIDTDISDYLYHKIFNTPIICKNGNIKKLKNIRDGFGYCGTNKNCECFLNREELKDINLLAERAEKRKLTNIQRYGVDNAMKSEEVKNNLIASVKNRSREKSNEIVEKTRQTNMEKYGVKNVLIKYVKYGKENPMNNEDVKKKQRKSTLESTGYENNFLNPEIKKKAKEAFNNNKEAIKNKIKEKHISKYGCWNTQTEEYKENIRNTNIKKYGVDNYAKSDECKKKISETNLNKYGYTSYTQTDECKQKINETNLNRYGCTSYTQTEEYKKKNRNTNIKKYGVNSHSQKNYSEYTKSILFNENEFKEFIIDKSINTISEMLEIDNSTVCKYYKKYNILIPSSTYENEIHSFLQSNNIKFEHPTRKIISPLELDFYLPDYKLAIEFNGLYWHSDKFVDKNYHLNKYLACEQKGIRLLMINEDEWISRSESIKRKILNLCGKSEKGIGARKLSMKKIDNKIAHDFVEQYHIQGKTGTAIASYGAFDGHELVAVIQYNKQRGTNDIELIRFCTNGKLYAGVFSRLFKYSVEQEGYEQVISFADLRYSDGNVYEKNGFSKERVIKPDYRYVRGNNTYHKSTFTKKNISNRFGIDMTNLTETQAMNELGYNRIYDCGKIKYVWSK